MDVIDAQLANKLREMNREAVLIGLDAAESIARGAESRLSLPEWIISIRNWIWMTDELQDWPTPEHRERALAALGGIVVRAAGGFTKGTP